MTRCQSIPFSLIAFLMYLKYKCIVPARFARRIYFLGTYNLGAHSLCISSSVFFPQRTNDLLTPNMPYNTCCLTSVFPNCVVQQLVVLFDWSGFFFTLDVILVRIFSMIQDSLFTKCISRQLW